MIKQFLNGGHLSFFFPKLPFSFPPLSPGDPILSLLIFSLVDSIILNYQMHTQQPCKKICG